MKLNQPAQVIDIYFAIRIIIIIIAKAVINNKCFRLPGILVGFSRKKSVYCIQANKRTIYTVRCIVRSIENDQIWPCKRDNLIVRRIVRCIEDRTCVLYFWSFDLTSKRWSFDVNIDFQSVWQQVERTCGAIPLHIGMASSSVTTNKNTFWRKFI